MQTVSESGLLNELRESKGVAVVGGLLYILILLGLWFLIYGGIRGLAGALFTSQVGPWIIYAFGGGTVVGAVLAVGIARYRLVAPTLVVFVAFSVSMYEMWQLLQQPYTLLPGTPYDIYLVGWPVVLCLAVVGGIIEKRVRG